MNLTIGIGVIAALAAALGCGVAHTIAKHMRWGFVPRYGAGVLLGLVAFAFPLFAAVTVEMGVLIYGLAWLIFGMEGLATWLAHQNDPDPRPPAVSITPEADALLASLDEELNR